jgi:thiol-disulfide isomerase/thioredoxin
VQIERPFGSMTSPVARLIRPALVTGLVAVLAACNRQAPEPSTAASSPAAAPAAAAEAHHPAGIDWYPGDVDAAFAQAKADNKPLYLYWGAEWCPPCAQIKSTIFNRREFQERSKLFVPVYLDGDTPGAQKQGERFGVIGYPTMILFRPDGTEITRLPGGVDVAKYASVLDVALSDARPVSQILSAVRNGEAVSQDDWRLLAYHSWATDNHRTIREGDELDAFRLLSERCPSDLVADCTRFLFEYLLAAADESEKNPQTLNGLDRAVSRKLLLERLRSPAVARANVEHIAFGAKDVIGLLSDPGTPERTQLTTGWRDAIDVLEAQGASPALSAPERLNMLRARVQLAQLDAPGQPLPASLVAEMRDAVGRVDAGTRDPYARQAAINSAANLYWEAGLEEDANRLLVAELQKSKQPYYFMLDLADLAQKAGREQEAVDWLARAYDAARGPATRFQWGASYLLGLLEMTPDDTQRIERVGLELLGELGESPDAFYQRTQMRLENLNGKLLEWGDTGKRRAVLERLRAKTDQICRGLPAGDDGRRNCEDFLRQAAPTARA